MRKALFAIGLVVSTLTAQAQQGVNPYPGYRQPWQPPPGQWQYAPPNQRQTGTPTPPPTTPRQQSPYAGQQSPYAGGWPGRQQPAYGQSPYYASNGQPPRLEIKISSKSPFVQENILLRLNIISSHNLKTATPEIPQTDTLALQKIEGPTVSSRKRKGSQEIVTSFVYQITPLRPGRIEIPAIHVKGDQENRTGYGRTSSEFNAVNDDRIVLDVKPSDPTSSPWLPLEQLSLKSRLPDNAKAMAGQPITLSIEMNAVGASGNQLPSLERQLKSEAFRVYREKTRTSTKLSKKGNKIIGRKVESFTLVPQFGGELRLPDLRLAWWNTKTGMPQHASVPVQPMAVSGGRRGDGMFGGLSETSTLFPAGSPAAFWIPVSVIFGVIFGYWMAVWLSNRRKEEAPPPAFPGLTQALKKPFMQMAPAFSPLGEKFRTATAVLNPITRWQRLRKQAMGLMPLSIRFWFCVRYVDEENDPEVWGYSLRFLANKHLGLPPRVPYTDIAKRIVEFHPKADPVKLQHLVHDLDQAVYGHEPLDFEQWKKDFKYEIRPRLRLLPGRSARGEKRSRQRLPSLNPRAAA